jgi:hypothetical protein
MKHDNEERQKKRMEEMKARTTKQGKQQLEAPPVLAPAQSGPPKALGRAARILEKERARENQDVTVALGRGHQAKEEARKDLKEHKMVAEANAKAAWELKKSLGGGGGGGNAAVMSEDAAKKHDKEEEEAMDTATNDTNGDGADAGLLKRKHEDMEESESKEKTEAKTKVEIEVEGFGGKIEEAEFDDDVDNDDEEEDEDDEEENEVEIPLEVQLDPKLAAAFKEKVKDAKSKQLDEFAKSVEDNVRLHETGWKVSQVACYSCHC